MSDENLFFPAFINLKNKKVLIIGAGKIAYRKATTLLKYGALITVVTKEVTDKNFYNLKNIDLKIENFDEKILENYFMVITATNDKNFNDKIFDFCNEKNILINNVTSKENMSCRFGSILETEEYQIGISAKGNPKKSKLLKEKLKDIIK